MRTCIIICLWGHMSCATKGKRFWFLKSSVRFSFRHCCWLLRGWSMQKTQVGVSLINTLTVYLCPYCRELVVWFTADVTESVWPLAVLNHNNAVHIQQKRRLIVVSLLSLEWRHWYFRTAKHTKKWVVWFSRGAGLISQVMPTSRLPAAVSLLSLHDV